MIDEDGQAQWIPIFVPVELAPEVLRLVSSTLANNGAVAGRSDWADANADDLTAFCQRLQPLEWRLILELASRDGPAPVGELADALGVEPGAVAGAMGPVNKRAKREGWAPPIQPCRFRPSGSSSSRRGLLLAAGLRAWVTAHADEAPA